MACRGEHEERVASLAAFIDRNAKIHSMMPRSRNIAPVFYLFLGLVFAGFGYFRGGGFTDLPFVLGCGFIVFSVIIFRYNQRAFGRIDA